MVNLKILIADFVLSAMWAWTSQIIQIVVHIILGLGQNQIAEFVSYAFKVISMFLFAKLGSISKGGSHNPLSILPGAISADFHRILFTVGARIPAQAIRILDYFQMLVPHISYQDCLDSLENMSRLLVQGWMVLKCLLVVFQLIVNSKKLLSLEEALCKESTNSLANISANVDRYADKLVLKERSAFKQ